MRTFILLFLVLFLCKNSKGQFIIDMIDTTKDSGKGFQSVINKNQRFKISGYFQPQFQIASTEGAQSFNGGNFQPQSANRFMLRRGRIKFDYVHFGKNTAPTVQFVFQFDATERGVSLRDAWGRILENKLNNFGLVMGMFTIPFGYEINLSSSYRESPERGRMSQILFTNQRDLGAMVSFEPRNKSSFLKYIKWDAGIFNGLGLSSFSDYDSYKDIITRLSLKPIPVDEKLYLSMGLSLYDGGFLQNDKYVYTLGNVNSQKKYIADSTVQNIGSKLPRKYYGGDMQIKFIHSKESQTELRGEYIFGKQTSGAYTSVTPSTLMTDPYYIRNFNGAYFYLLHSFNKHHQLGIKYDWYDPNIKLKGDEINSQAGATAADIKYSTIGFGYIYQLNESLKILAWYDLVKNETTALPGYTADLKDNVFTLRMQFRF
ncbi:MAG: porin [Bacteroidetes bacterium]|nr:porin [Bacteroidota bacterium]